MEDSARAWIGGAMSGRYQVLIGHFTRCPQVSAEATAGVPLPIRVNAEVQKQLAQSLDLGDCIREHIRVQI